MIALFGVGGGESRNEQYMGNRSPSTPNSNAAMGEGCQRVSLRGTFTY